MMAAQEVMHHNPGVIEYAEDELEVVQNYHLNHKIYTVMLSQKAKLDWVKAGDKNTTLFHQSIGARKVHNEVYGIRDANGDWQDTKERVENAFLNYYK